MQSRAPQFTVFTGSVHYPPDYLYYLSFITQGKAHWFLGANLKSGETQDLQALNWFYVLGGHMGSIFSIPSPITYQILVVIASICYLVFAYLLCSVCFPKQPVTRLIAYVLFLVSNAFPKITHTAAGWDFNFFYPFNNIGHPFIRLSNVPHHTLIQAAILAAFYAQAQYSTAKRTTSLILMGFAGLILGSMQPLQWTFVTGILGISGCIQLYSAYRKNHTIQLKSSISLLLPSIVLAFSGLPFALYIKHLYSSELFSYMLAWEKNQQVILTFWDFILLHGPVMLVGVLGVIVVAKKLNATSRILLLYSFIALLLFFSPIPAMVGLLNLRFVSVIPVLCAALVTATLLRMVGTRIPLNYRYTAMWFGAFCIIAITIPVTYAHVALGRPNANQGDVNIYLPLGAYQIYETAQRTIPPHEVTLVTSFFTQSFPAFTGRHVYEADIFGTLNFDKKHIEAVNFFAGKDTASNRLKWLHNNHISYIFTFAWTPISDIQELEVIQKNDYAILYKVK